MIEQLLKSLKMTDAIEALPRLEDIEDKDQFIISLLEAELEGKKLRGNKRRL